MVKTPAVLNVRVTVPFDVSGTLAGAPVPLKWMLCVTPANTQLTVPPTAMVTELGSNVVPATEMLDPLLPPLLPPLLVPCGPVE